MSFVKLAKAPRRAAPPDLKIEVGNIYTRSRGGFYLVARISRNGVATLMHFSDKGELDGCSSVTLGYLWRKTPVGQAISVPSIRVDWLKQEAA